MVNSLRWTYEEFLAFTLFYASSVDSKITDEERKLIVCKVGNEVCDKVYNDFIKLNEYERLQKILSYKDTYFPDEQKKHKLLADIKQIFLADKKYDNLERGIMLYLTKLL